MFIFVARFAQNPRCNLQVNCVVAFATSAFVRFFVDTANILTSCLSDTLLRLMTMSTTDDDSHGMNVLVGDGCGMIPYHMVPYHTIPPYHTYHQWQIR